MVESAAAPAPKVKTKKVTMIVQISGTRDGEDWPGFGEEITVPEDEADGLIANSLALTPADFAKVTKGK